MKLILAIAGFSSLIAAGVIYWLSKRTGKSAHKILAMSFAALSLVTFVAGKLFYGRTLFINDESSWWLALVPLFIGLLSLSMFMKLRDVRAKKHEVFPIPRIRAAMASAGLSVIVTWDNGQVETIDLTTFFDKFKNFRPLRTDRALFERLHVDENGTAIVWNDQMDIAAYTLQQLSHEAAAKIKQPKETDK